MQIEPLVTLDFNTFKGYKQGKKYNVGFIGGDINAWYHKSSTLKSPFPQS